MALKDFVRSITPTFLLNLNRRRKKNNRNNQLEKQKESGKALSKASILDDLERIGIKKGDSVLVHSSLSRIGYLEEGPKTLVDALLEQVGEEGNVLMPTSPNNVFQLNYIRNTPYFDVKNSPSKTGAITEYFRKLPQAKRSIHPTEPVSAIGPLADYFTKDHFGELTPYTEKSPFFRVSEQKGKILYIGVSLSMAGTNLHTLEDAVDFKYPVYHDEVFDFEVVDYEGVRHKIKTKVHNPVYSKKRKCDDLIPMFEKEGALQKVQIGEAHTLMVDAARFLDVMIEQYEKNGITMYTPYGE
ncbi:MAG: AAC(3) family N-acetyltransferase [Flavobacteriales bacterium]|jgi:aminoglycoside 3-N-acetyltransferase|nr:AAC(3) family N-acetyltransferase [Flavobacteriales bacterium]